MSIQTLRNLIQVNRYEKKLTLWQAAQKMGVATASVRAWEMGIGRPDQEQIQRLAIILGVNRIDQPLIPDY
jgi:transcriptional regulator with XRE-family HTH domain